MQVLKVPAMPMIHGRPLLILQTTAQACGKRQLLSPSHQGLQESKSSMTHGPSRPRLRNCGNHLNRTLTSGLWILGGFRGTSLLMNLVRLGRSQRTMAGLQIRRL